MSNAILPTFIGQGWPIKTQFNSTAVSTSVSGQEVRIGMYLYPKYRWTLGFEYLSSDAAAQDYQILNAFYSARHGAFDSFLYDDPDDNACVASNMGTGDGVTKAFPAMRSQGNVSEPFGAFKAGTTHVFINGSETFAFVANVGVITFTTAPSAGAVITITTGYYWRVRFEADMIEFQQVVSGIWSLKALVFMTTAQ